jgi:hypothetical protein
MNRFAITLEQLEAEVHVPVELQTSEQPEPPNPDLLDEADRERLALLGIAGAI